MACSSAALCELRGIPFCHGRSATSVTFCRCTNKKTAGFSILEADGRQFFEAGRHFFL